VGKDRGGQSTKSWEGVSIGASSFTIGGRYCHHKLEEERGEKVRIWETEWLRIQRPLRKRGNRKRMAPLFTRGTLPCEKKRRALVLKKRTKRGEGEVCREKSYTVFTLGGFIVGSISLREGKEGCQTSHPENVREREAATSGP